MTEDVRGLLRVEFLGPVVVWRGGAEVRIGSGNRRAVFAMLALQANRVVSRAELVDGVWGDSPPAKVDASLYTYVSALRGALEPARCKESGVRLLATVGSGYSLKLDADAVDVRAFEWLLERGGRVGGHDPARGVRTLDQALGLWRGDALSGVPGPFAESQRLRLNEMRLTTVERRAELLLELGRHAEVIAELSGLVNDFPLREGLRVLLMTALYRAGRQADALTVFQDGRRALVEGLGIEPGPALQRVHGLVLAGDSVLDAPGGHSAISVSGREPRRAGPWVSRPAVLRGAPPVFVGRAEELDTLRGAVSDVLAGRGRCVWVEGEPGIGKSSLLAAGLSGLLDTDTQIAWAAGDELGQRFPLRAMLECLGVTSSSADVRRAELAATLREETPASVVWGAGDPVLAAIDRLLGLVDELCADGPLVLVLDDLQWVDEASLLVWHRLSRAIGQLPLLLVGVSRPVPRRIELEQVWQAVFTAGGDMIALGPLPGSRVHELVTGLVGVPPGETLGRLIHLAAGNPLYAREIVGALMREDALVIRSGMADVGTGSHYRVPRSLNSAISRRLGFLSAPTTDVLRRATLLGAQFTLGDIAVAFGLRMPDLIHAVEEATSAGIIMDAGPRLAFRHSLIRHVLYEGMPTAVRVALHRQAAEALAAAGEPVERIAEQLTHTHEAPDTWTLEWLLGNSAVLAQRAPDMAVQLLRDVLAQPAVAANQRVRLTAQIAQIDSWLGREPETEARYVLDHTHDRDLAAEMRWILAHTTYRRGAVEKAVDQLRAGVRDPLTPQIWKARLEALLAVIQRSGLDDLDAALATARSALANAERVGDRFATAHALQTLWEVNCNRRDHAKALGYIDRALEVVAQDPDLAHLKVLLLDNRIFCLQNLDRLAEADDTLGRAQELLAANAMPGGVHISTAVHDYWLGRWDNALVELDAVVVDGPEVTFYGLRERCATLLMHGVAALIAGHRDHADEAQALLRSAAAYPVVTMNDRDNSDFLLAAQSLAAEQDGRVDGAIAAMEPILRPVYGRMLLRHQWLPQLVRLALSIGDTESAQQALRVCEAESKLEAVPARAHAATARCRGLIAGDPAPVLAVAEHYRAVGRQIELAEALEDAAVLLAGRSDMEGARRAFDEAVTIYAGLGAAWDTRRAESRLRPFGIRQESPVHIPRPASGREALSPIEERVTELILLGKSNPEIAAKLELSRKTVQAHVNRILGKLHVDSRADIGAQDWAGSRLKRVNRP
ncbi:BTAD domain-containing putative transcriptional regulator [Streptomyces sp. NPDC020681]|uniref:BTAD domain-containing putative transcriptional regulator n=1 Tax=Streptomyces sp. NPDC020681 TaxID=3365083 RepID=UPI00379682B1